MKPWMVIGVLMMGVTLVGSTAGSAETVQEASYRQKVQQYNFQVDRYNNALRSCSRDCARYMEPYRQALNYATEQLNYATRQLQFAK